MVLILLLTGKLNKMKKTVQIVTVPLQVRTNFGLFKDVEDNEIIFSETSIKDNPYFLPLQLLVLSDDEIQSGDWCTLLDSFGNVVLGNPQQYNPDLGHTLNDGLRKTIAAYPSLTGILPLSKETIQKWIDNGIPKECSVTVKKTIEKSIVNEWDKLNSPYTDSQGNLILEIEETVKGPTIPTDVEIEEKAKIDVDKTWAIYEGRPNYKSMLRTFKNGYKQALKDYLK